MKDTIWHTRDSGAITPATYRGRNFVRAYDKWTCEDPTSTALGTLTDAVSSHYGTDIGWQFGTPMIYNEGADAILLEMELVALPGRVALGKDPQIWTSHSFDGETWSQERALAWASRATARGASPGATAGGSATTACRSSAASATRTCRCCASR
jgi:hypothetical protein